MKAALSLPQKPTAILFVGALDIVVLLLVFFILVTEASQESGVMVSEAESRFRLSGYDDPVSVTVRGGVDPVVYIGRERVARGNFQARLEEIVQKSKADTVLLRVDRSASVVVEREVMEEALALGLRVALVGRDADLPSAETVPKPLAVPAENGD